MTSNARVYSPLPQTSNVAGSDPIREQSCGFRSPGCRAIRKTAQCSGPAATRLLVIHDHGTRYRPMSQERYSVKQEALEALNIEAPAEF